ncbi:MAG: hypothetical protein J7K53_08535 [Bacteroidales bacterium]|nr:hypothetical protein [Bacteroidales bacterium]
MKKVIQISIIVFIIMLLSCDKEPDDIKYCNSCELKTDGSEIVENKDGWLWYDSDFQAYIILIGSYNDQYCYVPCEYPDYFQPKDDLSVIFSGVVIEDPLILKAEPKVVYKCLDLDSIFLSNEISIRTNELSYIQGELIKVSVQNNSNDTVSIYLPCRGDGYSIINWIKKLEDNNWINFKWLPICTGRVLPYISDILSPNEILKDSIILWDSGNYRIVSRVFANGDTIDYYSNKFIVE